MPHLTIYRTFFTDVQDGEYDDPTTQDDKIDCEPDQWDVADGLTAVDLAAEALTDNWLTAPSTSPGFHPGIWWSYVDGSQIVDYYTGERVEETAHLEGFTPGEEEEIWALVTHKEAKAA